MDEKRPDMDVSQSPTFTQEQVNAIVQREKAEVAERTRQRLLAEQQTQMSQPSVNSYAQPNTSSPGFGGMQAPNLDALKAEIEQSMMQKFEAQQRKAEEESQRERLQEHFGKFFDKYGKGSAIYQDFDKITSDIDIHAFPHLALMMADKDNVPEIMYELAQNQEKLFMLNAMARETPQLAAKKLDALSQSIKANTQAKEQAAKVSPPLQRLKPSATVGVGDGQLSIRELRKSRALRG